jgi:ubiquinone biosynthesis protein COQ9
MSAAPRKKRNHAQNSTDALRTKILLAALPDVTFDGWHKDLVQTAARRAGIDADEADAAFPGGTRGLALYLSDWADAEMRRRFRLEDLSSLRIRDRVARGVEIRLDILAPWKQAVSSSLCYLGVAPGGVLLPAHIWRSADIIWQAAGDTATDYNRYTKRLLLCGVMSATLLFWLADDSAGHEKTRAFLGRRIDDALKAGKAAGGLLGKLRRGFTRRTGEGEPA